MSAEQFRVSPYAQLENYPPLSREDIERKWPGYRAAGNVKYGCWAKELIPFERYGSLAKRFVDLIAGELQNSATPTLADVGCGNGAGFISGVLKLAESVPELNILLSDIQPTALEEAQRLYTSKQNGKEWTLVLVQVDISDIDASQKIILANRGEQTDAIVSNNVLPFLTGEKLNRGLHTLQGILKQGGYGFILVCSIYNPASIGSTANTKALEIIHIATDGGKSEQSVAYLVPEMDGAILTFFTMPSFRKILEDSSFEVMVLEGSYNSRLRNGLGDEYPEHYYAIVKKK